MIQGLSSIAIYWLMFDRVHSPELVDFWYAILLLQEMILPPTEQNADCKRGAHPVNDKKILYFV